MSELSLGGSILGYISLGRDEQLLQYSLRSKEVNVRIKPVPSVNKGTNYNVLADQQARNCHKKYAKNRCFHRKKMGTKLYNELTGKGRYIDELI